MGEWQERKLGEALEVHHGWTFKGEFFTETGELIVMTPGNFQEKGGFKPKNGAEKYYLGPFPEKYLLPKDAVVVAMTEQAQGLLGSSATIPESDRYLHNQRIGLLEFKKPEILDPRFAYHLMNAPDVRRQIQATATGSKVRHTAPERIKDVVAFVPPIPDQRSIAGVLDSIDGLIANNQRRIKLLEEMAQAIYREWFVKFRYPGHSDVSMVDSAVGPIPEGWEVSPLSSVAEIVTGQSPKSEFYNEDGIGKPFHQGVADFGPHFPRTRKWCSTDGRSARDGDVLVSVRAPVGRINIADTDITIGRGLAAIRARDGGQGLMLGHLREVFTEEDSMGNDGAIFKSLSKAQLSAINVLVPAKKVANAANEVLSDNLALIRALSQSSDRLSSLRDTLLPKLVTGQVDVSTLDLDALVSTGSTSEDTVA